MLMRFRLAFFDFVTFDLFRVLCFPTSNNDIYPEGGKLTEPSALRK